MLYYNCMLCHLFVGEALDCERPWKSFHRNCILFEKGQMLNWYQAQKKCEESGASLISVNSYIEKVGWKVLMLK